jgi:putative hydrolase of the HAD superfamily
MILFDIDETLVNHNQAQTCAARLFLSHFNHLLPHPEDEFCKLWDSVMLKHFGAFTKGEISFTEHRRRRIRELFAEVSPTLSDAEVDARFEIYLKGYENSWALFDDVLPCLSALSGCRLGIISNGNTDQQKLKLRRLGLENTFEVVVISEEVGVAKPKPQIFLEACRRASLKPQDCVYVGDHLEVDVLGSQSVGMKAVWLNRTGTTSTRTGVVEINSLSMLSTAA